MTDADKPAFVQAFGRLAVALRSGEPDAVQLKVYYDTLRDLEVEFVVDAATRLLRGEFFPTTGAWRAMAERVERERVEAHAELLRKLPEPLCAACADTGWADAGPGLVQTRRGMKHAASRTVPCDCRQQRRLEILGRRPMPALPEHVEPPDPGAFDKAMLVSKMFAKEKAIPPLPRLSTTKERTS